MVPKRAVKIKEEVPEDAEVSCQGIKRKSSADQLVAYATPKKKEKPSELEQVVLAGSPRPSTGSQMTLAAIFEKAGSPCKIVTTLSPGAKKALTLQDVLCQAAEVRPTVTDIVAAVDEQAEPAQICNGSADKWGKLRANVGGRPRKHDSFKRGVQGPSQNSNRLPKGGKLKRFEIKGKSQALIVEQLHRQLVQLQNTKAAESSFWKEVGRCFV